MTKAEWIELEFRLNPPTVGDTLVTRVQLWDKHEVCEALIVEDLPDHYVVNVSFKKDTTAQKSLSKYRIWKRVYEIKRKGT